MVPPYFTGPDWPTFWVVSYVFYRDGRPAILCRTTTGREWVITWERWLDERRLGLIRRV